MSRIPKKIKYLSIGSALLIFLVLNSTIGLNIIVDSINLIDKITGYHFGISTHTLDYLVFASFPIFGLLYNSTRSEFKKSELLMDSMTVLGFIILMVSIGLYLLTFIGRPKNPLFPQSILIEPFDLYSTLLIGIGIATPFLLLKLIKK